MNPTVWLLVGGTLGWLVGLRMQRSNQRDMMESMLAGLFGALVGALLGGALVNPSMDLGTIDTQSFSLLSLGHAFLGSALLLTALRMFRRPLVAG